MADSGWQRYLGLASGVTEVTLRSAESVVKTLVRQGEVAADAAEGAVDALLARSEENRRMLAGLVRSETQRAVSILGLASQADVERLQGKVSRLEASQKKGRAPAAAKTRPSAAARAAASKTITDVSEASDEGRTRS